MEIKRSLLAMGLGFFAASGLFFTGCAKAPYTERGQLMMISQSDEKDIGEKAFDEVKKESTINADPRLNAMIQRVGQRIAMAAARPDYEWEFIIIKDPQINAFALPGGKVAFYDGILPVCEDEAGMAVVMGHEVAHALARHGAERMSQQEILTLGKVAIMAALGGESPATREMILRAYGVGTTLGVALPYSRTQESEADEIGLILMAKAGYDPAKAVDFWRRMAAQSRGKAGFEFLSTHPSDETRIRKLEAQLPKARGIYNQAVAANPGWNRPPEPVAR